MAFPPSRMSDAEVIRMWQRKDASEAAARKPTEDDDNFDPSTLFDDQPVNSKERT